MIFTGDVHGWRLLPLIFAHVVKFSCSELIGELDRALPSTHENVRVLENADGGEATRGRWFFHRSLHRITAREV